MKSNESKANNLVTCTQYQVNHNLFVNWLTKIYTCIHSNDTCQPAVYHLIYRPLLPWQPGHGNLNSIVQKPNQPQNSSPDLV